MIFSAWDSEGVSECLPSPAIWDIAKDAYFCLTPSSILNHELYNWGGGKRLEEEQMQFLKGIIGIWIFLYLGLHQEPSLPH